MIKIYADWNVMSQMNQGNLSELSVILKNRDKFLPVYSPSHIGDILASVSEDDLQKEQVKNDLQFITTLTGNLCLAYNSKSIYFERYDPAELLNEKSTDRQFFDNFSIDSLLPTVEGEGNELINASIAAYKTLLKSINLDAVFIEAFNQPETAEVLDKLFPGFRNDPTFEGMFKSFGRMYSNMNETDDYKHLREMVQKIGLNSSHFNPEKNPFDLIEQSYKKTGINPDAYVEKGKHVPEWFDEITNEYLKLDLHGYKSDKIVVNSKTKKTFRNVTEDASHSAFASRCDFYITLDDKNYHKTKRVYEKLGIFTRVVKPSEFLDVYNGYLYYESFEQHLQSAIQLIKAQQHFHELQNEDGTFFGTVCYPPHFFFDFFNKITVPKSDEAPYFLLSKEHPSHSYIVAYEEINGLVEKFLNKLGVDDNGKGAFSIEEITGPDWDGRRWFTNLGEFRLRRLNGWFQMYLYLPELKNNSTSSPTLKGRLTRFFRISSKPRK